MCFLLMNTIPNSLIRYVPPMVGMHHVVRNEGTRGSFEEEKPWSLAGGVDRGSKSPKKIF